MHLVSMMMTTMRTSARVSVRVLPVVLDLGLGSMKASWTTMTHIHHGLHRRLLIEMSLIRLLARVGVGVGVEVGVEMGAGYMRRRRSSSFPSLALAMGYVVENLCDRCGHRFGDISFQLTSQFLILFMIY
jgi:hypothetical protein